MDDFIQAYLDLLIYQYRNKPKAEAEISAIVKEFGSIFDFYNSFETEFDLDSAVGNQLDIIGRIVGLSRTVPLGLPKIYFGFNNKNSNALGFKQAPFKNGNEKNYTDLQLNDFDYRFFLKAKISKNFAKSDVISIDEIVSFLFNEKAFITDGLDMTITLYLDESVDINRVRIVQQLNLLPKPQAVRYNNFRQYSDGGTFGFKNKNLNATTFGNGKFSKGII